MDMKYIKQPTDITCGPTCIKMVSEFCGKDIDSITDIAKICGTNEKEGTSPDCMIKGLDHYKFNYKIHPKYKGSMEKLDRCLEEGHVGILWTTTDGITHWIIVDKKKGDRYNVLDPWKGVLTYDEDKLRGLWNDKKFYFFEIINGV